MRGAPDFADAHPGYQTPAPPSAPDGEKLTQQGRRFGFPDAAIDLRPMQAGGGGEITHAVLDRAALGIGGAVIKTPDAGERNRPRAHRSGFGRHEEGPADEPLRPPRPPAPR